MLHVMADEVQHIKDHSKRSGFVTQGKLKGNDPDNQHFGHDHDHYEKINVTQNHQVENLEGIFFPTELLKIAKLCKSFIMKTKALHTQFSMLHHKISRCNVFVTIIEMKKSLTTPND